MLIKYFLITLMVTHKENYTDTFSGYREIKKLTKQSQELTT